jgi:hypothetical protein
MPYIPVRYVFKDGFYGYSFLYREDWIIIRREDWFVLPQQKYCREKREREADALPQQKFHCTSRRETREEQKHIAPVVARKRQKEAAAEADVLPLQKRCNRNCSQFGDDK